MKHPLDKLPYKDFSLPKHHKERIVMAGPTPDLRSRYPLPCPMCKRSRKPGKLSLCYDQVHSRYFIKHSHPDQHVVPLCEGATGAEAIQKWNDWVTSQPSN